MTQGWQRVGALAQIPEVVRSLGGDPDEIIQSAGVHPDTIKNREGQIPFAAACLLMQRAAERTGCAHFGLLVGQRNASESLGLVGNLMRNAPRWGRALLDLTENQHRYVRGAVPYLMVRKGVAWAGYCVYQRDAIGMEHMEDGAIAIGFNLMRELCGARPIEIWLARKAPADPRPYQSYFRVPVRFDSSQSALVFPKAELDLEVKGADAAQRAALEAQVRDYWALGSPPLSHHVTRLLRSRVLFNDVQIASVAGALVMHPRILERALKSEGTTFRSLLGETRVEVARRLLAGTRLSITEIGTAIGYADTSAFSNAFRRMTGVGPRSWRTAEAPMPDDGARMLSRA